ncbi:sugar ABC transporter substrate-binding protein [Spirochaetia bacterium]|nr:sugar ABC transporter substrate-binding protein [Spirochaetia bacterium]
MKKSLFCLMMMAGAVLILLGCGQKGSAAGGIASDPGPLGKYKEPVTVSWGISSSSVQMFRPGDSYESNVWTREFKDTLNIDLKVGFTADGGSGAYENQLNLGLASGDLPDVVRINNYRIFDQGAKAGLWADISTVYDEYANDWMKMIKQKYPAAFEFATVDKKLYGVPPLNDNRQFAHLLWIRDDWLQKLNLKAPTTIDELIEVARAFTLNDPDGNGRKDTYGLGLQNALVSPTFGALNGFFSAFGIPAYNHISYYRGPDGKMTFSFLEPRMKDALEVLAQMYKEGLIDPEFTVKDVNKIGDDMTSGRIGMEYGLNWNTWWGFNGLFSATGKKVHPYAIPTVPGINPALAHESNMAAGDITVISSKHKNPEALVKMFNLHNTLVNPYMSDETYDKYDQDEQWRLTPALINEPQETIYGPLLQAAFEKGSSEGMPANLIARYNQINAFAKGTDTSPDSYGLWGQYSLEGSVYIIMNTYIPRNWLKESDLGPVWPQSLIDNSASLQKITVQALTEIITGTKPVSSFDTYVQDWLRAGGQQVLDDLDKLYPAK